MLPLFSLLMCFTPQPGKSLFTTVREFVENALDAAESIRVLPDICVTMYARHCVVPNYYVWGGYKRNCMDAEKNWPRNLGAPEWRLGRGRMRNKDM